MSGGIKPTPSYNLKVKHPALARQWIRHKNYGLGPESFTPFSQKYAWWKCSKGHEWRAQIKNRSYGEGCPYCAGRMVCPDNCLSTVNPDIARQWHIEKNGTLTPSDVTSGANRKVWWKCAKGHAWQATVANRVKRGTFCPYCQNRKLDGKNSFAALYPDIANQWHAFRNGDRTPQGFPPKSDSVVWWTCENGHEWRARIERRVSGTDCPFCSGKKPSELNNLGKVNPSLALQWHMTKNGTQRPEDFTFGSQKKVWWQCVRGHEWIATIKSRNSGRGCPLCAGRRSA